MRAKLFFVMAVALFWSASVFSQTKVSPVGAFENGNNLFGICSDDHHFNEAYCKGYVVGVADAIMVANAQMATVGSMIPTCLPKDHLVAEQVRDVVVQYLTAHPEKRHEAAAGHALVALQAAFPCK